MKKTIFFLMLIILSSSIYAKLSDFSTDWNLYIKSDVVNTRIFDDVTNYVLNGSSASIVNSGDSIFNYGWTAGVSGTAVYDKSGASSRLGTNGINTSGAWYSKINWTNWGDDNVGICFRFYNPNYDCSTQTTAIRLNLTSIQLNICSNDCDPRWFMCVDTGGAPEELIAQGTIGTNITCFIYNSTIKKTQLYINDTLYYNFSSGIDRLWIFSSPNIFQISDVIAWNVSKYGKNPPLAETPSLPIINIIKPLNNSFNREIPLNFTYNFANFNPTNCTAYHDLTGIFTQFYSIKAGQSNITYNTTIENYTYNPYINGFYRFEEGSGSIAIDSMNNNNATNINGASYQASKGSNYTGAYSLQFNGVNQYVNDSITGNYERTQGFSVTFWMKTSSTPTLQSNIIGKIDNTAYTGWEIFQTGNVLNVALLNAITNYIHVRATNFTINNNVWHFISVTYAGTSTASGTKIYIDGNQQTTDVIKDNLAGTILTAKTFKIGLDSTTYYYNGNLDEVSVWNITLNNSQISDIYNNGVPYIVNNSLVNQTNITIDQNLSKNTNITFNYSYANNTVNDFKFYINCYNDHNINSSIYKFHYDNDFYPPFLTFYFPNMTYNETYNVQLWFNFTSSEYSFCSENSPYFDLYFSNGSYFSYLENMNITQGNHSVNISCRDYSYNFINTTIYMAKDTGIPSIIIYSPENNSFIPLTQKTLKLNHTFTDNILLYDYNISISCYDDNTDEYQIYFNESALIYGKSYTYSKKLNIQNFPNSTCIENIRICDAHTQKEISDKKVIAESNNIKFDMGNAIIKIASLDKNIKKVSYKKLKDRYTFDFDYSENMDFFKYRLESNSDIIYLPNSPFKAHFVTSNYWVDFENIEGDTLVEKENNSYIITIKNEKNNKFISFNSIGELNCISSFIMFNRGEIPVSKPFGFNFDTDNIAHVFLLFTLIFLYISVMVIGFYFKNFGFVGFGFTLGIAIGLILASIHIFFFFMFILINSAIIITFAKTKK